MKLSITALVTLFSICARATVPLDPAPAFAAIEIYRDGVDKNSWFELDLTLGERVVTVSLDLSTNNTFIRGAGCSTWDCPSSKTPRIRGKSWNHIRDFASKSAFGPATAQLTRREKRHLESLSRLVAGSQHLDIAASMIDQINSALAWFPVEAGETPLEAVARVYSSMVSSRLDGPEAEEFQELQVSFILDTIEAVSELVTPTDIIPDQKEQDARIRAKFMASNGSNPSGSKLIIEESLLERINSALEWFPVEAGETPLEAVTRVYSSMVSSRLDEAEAAAFQELQMSIILDTIEAVSDLVTPPVIIPENKEDDFSTKINGRAVISNLAALRGLANPSLEERRARIQERLQEIQLLSPNPVMEKRRRRNDRADVRPSKVTGPQEIVPCSKHPRRVIRAVAVLAAAFLPPRLRGVVTRTLLGCTLEPFVPEDPIDETDPEEEPEPETGTTIRLPSGVTLQGSTASGSFSLTTAFGPLTFTGDYFAVSNVTSGGRPNAPEGVIGLGRWPKLPAKQTSNFLSQIFTGAELDPVATIGMFSGDGGIALGNFEDFIGYVSSPEVYIGEPITINNWLPGSEWNFRVEYSPAGDKAAALVPTLYKATFDIGSAFSSVDADILERMTSSFEGVEQTTLFNRTAYLVDTQYCTFSNDVGNPAWRVALGGEQSFKLGIRSLVREWDGKCYFAFLANSVNAGEVFNESNPRRMVFGEPFFRDYAVSFDYENDQMILRNLNIMSIDIIGEEILEEF